MATLVKIFQMTKNVGGEIKYRDQISRSNIEIKYRDQTSSKNDRLKHNYPSKSKKWIQRD
jgi:hypothetical protein